MEPLLCRCCCISQIRPLLFVPLSPTPSPSLVRSFRFYFCTAAYIIVNTNALSHFAHSTAAAVACSFTFHFGAHSLTFSTFLAFHWRRKRTILCKATANKSFFRARHGPLSAYNICMFYTMHAGLEICASSASTTISYVHRYHPYVRGPCVRAFTVSPM